MTEDEETRKPPRSGEVVLQTLGDFWCEAAVLVAVFGILNKVLKADDLTWRWTAGAIAYARLFLVVGTVFKLLARN